MPLQLIIGVLCNPGPKGGEQSAVSAGPVVVAPGPAEFRLPEKDTSKFHAETAQVIGCSGFDPQNCSPAAAPKIPHDSVYQMKSSPESNVP